MAAGDIKGDVLRMYLNHPCPNYSAAERRAIFPAELARYGFSVSSRSSLARG